MAIVTLTIEQHDTLVALNEHGMSSVAFWKEVLGVPPTKRVWNVSRPMNGRSDVFSVFHESTKLIKRPAPQDFNLF